jgi:uncharacterized repeat protein (TIGR04076 family)
LSDLIIEVEEIRGGCPVFKKGDRIVLRGGYNLDVGETGALCSHAMGSLLPFLQLLNRGVPPAELGLAKDGEDAFINCPDPGEPYTNGGTVTFRISRS